MISPIVPNPGLDIPIEKSRAYQGRILAGLETASR